MINDSPKSMESKKPRTLAMWQSSARALVAPSASAHAPFVPRPIPLSAAEKRALSDRYNALDNPLTTTTLVGSFFRSLGEDVSIEDLTEHLSAVDFVPGLGGACCALSLAQLESVAERLKRARHETRERERLLADRLDALQLFSALGGSPDGSGAISESSLKDTLDAFDLVSEVPTSLRKRQGDPDDAAAADSLNFLEFLDRFDKLTCTTNQMPKPSIGEPAREGSFACQQGTAVPSQAPLLASVVTAMQGSPSMGRPSTATPVRTVENVIKGTEKSLIDHRTSFLTTTHGNPLVSLRPRSAGHVHGKPGALSERPQIRRSRNMEVRLVVG